MVNSLLKCFSRGVHIIFRVSPSFGPINRPVCESFHQSPYTKRKKTIIHIQILIWLFEEFLFEALTKIRSKSCMLNRCLFYSSQLGSGRLAQLYSSRYALFPSLCHRCLRFAPRVDHLACPALASTRTGSTTCPSPVRPCPHHARSSAGKLFRPLFGVASSMTCPAAAVEVTGASGPTNNSITAWRVVA